MTGLRRRLLAGGALCGLAAAGGGLWWARERLANPCDAPELPEHLAQHALVREALTGLDLSTHWDCHVHLLGLGGAASSAVGQATWVNPAMQTPTNPIPYAQYRFYLNAACIDDDDPDPDAAYVDRVLDLHRGWAGSAGKLLLMAFDYRLDDEGRPEPARSAFHVADAYAERIAKSHPNDCEWTASIHPYRPDAVQRLRTAVAAGARAVKWLPPVMNIDPASPRCDAFYAALAELGLPLLCHGGDERAVSLDPQQALGNPLRLRRALDAGVRVIVAHCASLGTSADLDRGPDGPRTPNFELFARLMDEPRYADLVHGDLSAVTILTRPREVVETLLARTDWHARLVDGSDYPLPAVLPIIRPGRFAEWGLLDAAAVPVLEEIQRVNALAFDLLLKRMLRRGGQRFAAACFDTARHFTRRGSPARSSRR